MMFLKKTAAKIGLYKPTVVDILVDAKEVLETKQWTQGAGARDKDGDLVHSRSEEAVSFCSIGAINRASHHFGGGFLLGTLRFEAEMALQDVIDKDVITWNDSFGRTKEEVLEAFSKAIEKAK